jgi:hypothetical protein
MSLSFLASGSWLHYVHFLRNYCSDMFSLSFAVLAAKHVSSEILSPALQYSFEPDREFPEHRWSPAVVAPFRSF